MCVTCEMCQDIRTADWSENVAPFWPAVIKSALTWKGLTSLLRSGMILPSSFPPLMIIGKQMLDKTELICVGFVLI